MTPEKYKKFQEFQNKLFFFCDAEFPNEEMFGSVLFQQMANTACEIFEKFEDIAPIECEGKNDQ